MLSLPAHVVPVAVAAALVVSLSGCVPTPASREPTVSPPRPTATPLFASDEEALAAAEEAYAAYLAIASVISADGGREPERITPFVTEEYLDRAISTFDPLSESSLAVTGETTFDSSVLVYFKSDQLQIQVCLDVSRTVVVDSHGRDVTPLDRPARIPLLVLFEGSTGHLLIDDSKVSEGARC